MNITLQVLHLQQFFYYYEHYIKKINTTLNLQHSYINLKKKEISLYTLH